MSWVKNPHWHDVIGTFLVVAAVAYGMLRSDPSIWIAIGWAVIGAGAIVPAGMAKVLTAAKGIAPGTTAG